jgi:hypothetical protein
MTWSIEEIQRHWSLQEKEERREKRDTRHRKEKKVGSEKRKTCAKEVQRGTNYQGRHMENE